MSDQTKDKIEFQCVMSYRAYRRIMITTRVGISVVIVGGALALCAFSIMVGIICAVVLGCLCAIAILVSIGNEQTYTVYNTRVVIKKRGDDNRKSVPLDSIVGVKFKSSPLEKSLKTGTITIRARSEKGGVKRYKLKHVFDAQQVVEYLTDVAKSNTAAQ